MIARLLCLVALLAAPCVARAAGSPWSGNAHAAARLVTATDAVGSAAAIDAGVEFRLAPGWHIYWRAPGDAGLPPTLDWAGSANLARAELAWPAPERLVTNGLQSAVYRHEVTLPVRIALSQPGQAARLHLALDYAACADVCVPYHAALDLALPPGPAQASAEAGALAAAQALVPRAPATIGLHVEDAVAAPGAAGGTVLALGLRSDAMPWRAPDLFLEGLDPVTAPAPRVDLDAGGRRARLLVDIPRLLPTQVAGRRLTGTLVEAGRSATFGIVPQEGKLPTPYGVGWPAILAVALLGGLVLNAMPCVLPVLSLKLLAVAAQRGAGRREVRAGLMATAAGVLLSFLVLAAGLAGLRLAGAAVGWGIQFQQPWFLAAMALVTALFAASLWDLLPIGLPGLSAIAAVHARRRWLDALLAGVVATLLATPCSAPFVGTAVGFALSRGPAQIFAVFAALGLGMAAPYLLVAAAPALVSLLPRPGAWMLLLRRGMGVLLAATAVWLLWVLAAVAGGRGAGLAAGALLLCVALLAWRRHGVGAGRWVAAGAAGCALGAAVLPALVATPATPRGGAQAGWQRFDLAAIPALVARGDTVVVDVTADWCLTCKANALAVLDRDPVAARLHDPAVIAMRADWTRPDAAISRYLQSFGRYGVPLDVVYGPRAPAGTPLPELLTTQAVVRALAAAAATQNLAAR